MSGRALRCSAFCFMNISPRDILNKDFSRKMRGYDPEEVDEFLDDIIKQFESLIEENENIIAKNEELKTEVAKLRARDVKSTNMEDRLMGAVINAQKNATLYLEKAEEQATKVMDIANANARAILESAHMRLDNLRQEITKYERIIVDYKRQFRRLLEEQAAYMDAHTISAEELESTRRDVDNAVARLEQTMHDLEDSSEQDVVRVNDILKQSRDETDYDFQQSTAHLQEIVDDIIDD